MGLIEEQPKVIRYNISTGKIQYFELPLEEGPTELLVLEEGYLFLAWQDDGNEEVVAKYGLFNTITGEEAFWTKEGVRPLSLSQKGNKVLIKGDTVEEGIPLNVESRFVFDVSTRESSELQRDETSDFRSSTLSIDGTLILTVAADFSYFRAFDVQTGKLVQEFSLGPVAAIPIHDYEPPRYNLFVEIFPVSQNTVALHLVTTDMYTVSLARSMRQQLKREIRIFNWKVN